jgi:hypothetical protein
MVNILTIDNIIEDMKAFVGIARPTITRPKLWECNSGGDRVSFNLDKHHIERMFLVSQNEIHETRVFDNFIIERWKLSNALATQNMIMGGSLGPFIDCRHAEALSTLSSFPLLELIAQRWTNLWDENGKMISDFPQDRGLVDKKGNTKSFKAGAGISSFYEKMQILRMHLDPDARSCLDDFDSALRRPEIAGGQLAQPLFLRLSNRRNAWAHGQSFNDGEPYILSLLISFFYVVSNANGPPEQS